MWIRNDDDDDNDDEDKNRGRNKDEGEDKGEDEEIDLQSVQSVSQTQGPLVSRLTLVIRVSFMILRIAIVKARVPELRVETQGWVVIFVRVVKRVVVEMIARTVL